MITIKNKKLKNKLLFDIINNNQYSIATIQRKSDKKIFGCYARNNKVLMDIETDKSWFIESEGEEELELLKIDTTIFNVLEIIYENE